MEQPVKLHIVHGIFLIQERIPFSYYWLIFNIYQFIIDLAAYLFRLRFNSFLNILAQDDVF